MNKDYLSVFLIGAGVVITGLGGYWIGQRQVPKIETIVQTPDNAQPGSPESNRKPLYYRNPMGLADTSPVPKKDSMGMDYTPVFADEVNEPRGTVKVSLDKVQRLGVRTEQASRRILMHSIRAVGAVQIDERRIFAVSPRFEGWVEKLLVNSTGEPVRQGQPLMEVYAPQLLIAQEEYQIAKQFNAEAGSGSGSVNVTETAALMEQAALRKLRNLDAPAALIDRLIRGGPVERHIVLPSPVSGIVLEKMIIQGAKFNAGDTIYRIADVGSVWVLVDVFEQDLQHITIGQRVDLKITALPNRTFSGKVDYIYPTVSRETRAAKVRVQIANPDYVLRADMYASAEFQAPGGVKPVIAVPISAVIDSGVRQVVLVERGEGRYEPRPVKLGMQGEDFIEILEGITESEMVVVSANFLIDAESNLRAALQSFQVPESNLGENK